MGENENRTPSLREAITAGWDAAVAEEAPAVEEAPAETAPAAEEGVILGSDCVYCTLCAKKCPVNAITVDRESKSWSINHAECIKCGACVSACPKKTLSMGPIA